MEKMPDRKAGALAAAIAAYVIFGFSFMASSIAMESISPSMLLGLRFLVSFLIMTALLGVGAGKVRLAGKPVGRFLLLGLCQPVIYFIGEANGIKLTNSSFSGVMISLIPVVTALLAPVFLREKLTVRIMGWILCSVFGVALISVTQKESGTITPAGILYLLVAVVSASLFVILSRSLSEEFTSFERTYVMMAMGFAVFFTSAVVREGSAFPASFAAAVTNPRVMCALLYLSAVSSVVAFFCQNYSMTYLDATRVIVFANIAPVVSVAAGVMILGEPFSPVHAVGIFLILLGVYQVNRLRTES